MPTCKPAVRIYHSTSQAIQEKKALWRISHNRMKQQAGAKCQSEWKVSLSKGTCIPSQALRSESTGSFSSGNNGHSSKEVQRSELRQRRSASPTGPILSSPFSTLMCPSSETWKHGEGNSSSDKESADCACCRALKLHGDLQLHCFGQAPSPQLRALGLRAFGWATRLKMSRGRQKRNLDSNKRFRLDSRAPHNDAD